MERQNPGRSFTSRNENVTNRRALESTREISRSNGLQSGSRSNGTVRNEGTLRSSNGSEMNRTGARQRVSNEEFSRMRSTSGSVRSERATVTPNRSFNNDVGRSGSISTSRREAAPASSRIERSSRISSQPNRSFSQPSRSATPSMSRSSSSNMSRSSAPSMSRSSGSMGGGRSSSGGMTRGGR